MVEDAIWLPENLARKQRYQELLNRTQAAIERGKQTLKSSRELVVRSKELMFSERTDETRTERV